MILSVHQPQYLPWFGYFDKIARSDCFVFLDTVQYKAREFQNRNKIRTKNREMWLTVPVISKGLGRQKICDVKIDNSSDWRKKHWESIKRCYTKAPFFKEYASFFENIYCSNWIKLADLNITIIKYLLKELKIDTPLHFESEIGTTAEKTERIIEICKKINANTYLSGVGGKAYLKEERFREEGIKLAYQEYTHPVYHQQFMSSEKDFIPYMSIMDLFFNEGVRSREILLT